MNAVVHSDFDIVEEKPFFAPVSSDLIDGLIGQYQQARGRIGEVAAFAKGEVHNAVIHYFLEGNRTEERGRISMSTSAAQLFDEAGAVRALNASYWSKALALTDVLDMMPQKRRDDWNTTIREMTTPDFEEDMVRTTLLELLNMRSQFLAERVDGIFRALSGDHVTNVPEGFGRRMIIARILTSYDTIEHSRVGYINDLRCVIAKFMGRTEPGWQASDDAVRIARHRRGEWITIDGGALRLRVYKVGTAHLEVHPDMAWRLNMVLAHLHPLAIPAQFRMKPKKAPKAFTMMGRPLPFAVLNQLARMRVVKEKINDGGWKDRYKEIRNARAFEYSDADASVRDAATRVLYAIGATDAVLGKAYHYFQFDYEPTEVLEQIITSGCIPDQKAHQFYPTPETVGAAAAAWADIGPAHTVLEPSAGQGDLAGHLPGEQTTCVEIAPLHCAILRAKGYATIQADFLARQGICLWDRIVMNPPYSEGRWKLHTEHAAGMLKPGGVLVAVLPASARFKDFLAGGETEWSRVYENEFAGTSTDVVLMKFTKAA